MAEEVQVEAEVAPKKKKPMVPIALVLLLLLVTGGFFAMKRRAAKHHLKAPIAVAEKESDLEEFLTNTKNPTVYVRAKMSVRLRKDFDESKFKENMGDVRDAVLVVLNSTPPSDVTDPSKRSAFKKKLADKMNEALQSAEKPSDKSGDAEREAPASTKDWDSQTGPVMKVRFLSLATQ